MKRSSVELKQYGTKWTRPVSTVALTIAMLFPGSALAQDKNSATESNNICLQTADGALASCKSAAESDYQVALGKAGIVMKAHPVPSDFYRQELPRQRRRLC